MFSAKNKGTWGNYLFLQIEDGSVDPGNEFKITVRRQIEIDIVPENFLDIAPLEVHDNLSMDENATNYVVNVLSQNSSLSMPRFFQVIIVCNGVFTTVVLGLRCLWGLIVASRLTWTTTVSSLLHCLTVLLPQQILPRSPQLFRPLSEP